MKIFIDLYQIKIHCITHQPIDFVSKEELDKCYLTVHNFVSFKSTIEINPSLNSTNSIYLKFNESSQDQNFHSYISSYNRPFLLELVQKSKNDCLCCN